MAKEREILQTIIVSYDWEEVLEYLVREAQLDPWDIDIVRLADLFLDYLRRLRSFDFRIPARFILIAAILLRMKCEVIRLVEEKPKRIERIDIEAPLLQPPVKRVPKRRVTLAELTRALQKALEFQERKRQRRLRLRRAVELLITYEEDIELRMEKLLQEIKTKHITRFSQLLTELRAEEIVRKFLPLLHLVHCSKLWCYQLEPFGEIFISLEPLELSSLLQES